LSWLPDIFPPVPCFGFLLPCFERISPTISWGVSDVILCLCVLWKPFARSVGHSLWYPAPLDLDPFPETPADGVIELVAGVSGLYVLGRVVPEEILTGTAPKQLSAPLVGVVGLQEVGEKAGSCTDPALLPQDSRSLRPLLSSSYDVCPPRHL